MTSWVRGLAGGMLVVALFSTGCGGSPEYAPEEVGAVPPDVDQQVGAIVKNLTDNPTMNVAAKRALIMRLKEYAKGAQSALPTLEKMAAEEADPNVKAAATEAIAAIKGGGAPPAQ